MQSMALSVSWQFDIPKIWALFAFMPPLAAYLALHRRLASILLHRAKTFRSSLTDAINKLVEIRMHRPRCSLMKFATCSASARHP